MLRIALVSPVAGLLLVGNGFLPKGAGGPDLGSFRKIDALTPVEVQVALALSAGPPVAAEAGVYVLGPKGYSKVKESSNGFNCLVTRERVDTLEPECFDAEGSATTLRARLFVEEMRVVGKSDPEIERLLAIGYKEGRFLAPQKPGIVYMLSPYNYVHDPGRDQVIHYPGHLMFYAPYATGKDVGSGPGAPYLVNPGRPDALMIVVPAGPCPGDTREP
jgi:hypothetical protein